MQVEVEVGVPVQREDGGGTASASDSTRARCRGRATRCRCGASVCAPALPLASMPDDPQVGVARRVGRVEAQRRSRSRSVPGTARPGPAPARPSSQCPGSASWTPTATASVVTRPVTDVPAIPETRNAFWNATLVTVSGPTGAVPASACALAFVLGGGVPGRSPATNCRRDLDRLGDPDVGLLAVARTRAR